MRLVGCFVSFSCFCVFKVCILALCPVVCSSCPLVLGDVAEQDSAHDCLVFLHYHIDGKAMCWGDVFSNLMKHLNPQIQRTQWTPSRIKTKPQGTSKSNFKMCKNQSQFINSGQRKDITYRVYSFSRVATTKYHQLGDLEQNSIVLQFWRLEVWEQGVDKASSLWNF